MGNIAYWNLTVHGISHLTGSTDLDLGLKLETLIHYLPIHTQHL